MSEALMSELKAIASGLFAISTDPVAVSFQMSVSSSKKAINPLSLGAYTVNE